MKTVGQIPSHPITGHQFRADGSGVTCHSGDIARFLLRATEVTGLTIIAGPFVSEAHGQGIVIIAESHIWCGVQGADAIAIVFSCKRFDETGILEALRDIFGGTWRSRWSVGRSDGAGAEKALPREALC